VLVFVFVQSSVVGVVGVVIVLGNLFYWSSQISAFSFQVYSFHHSFLCKVCL